MKNVNKKYAPTRVEALLRDELTDNEFTQELNFTSEECTDPHAATLRNINTWIASYGNDKTGGVLTCYGWNVL